MADLSKITLPDGNTYNFKDEVARVSIPYGYVDSTSTSKAFTATVPGVTSYYDGLTILLYNGVVTSASGYTVNINNLGAYGTYNNMTMGYNTGSEPKDPTRDTTIFNIAYAMLLVFCTDIGHRGITGWICYRGYDANTNTIGYQVRSNSSSLPMTSYVGRYRLLFTSADGQHFVPATNSTSTNATTARTVCQDPINPFGRIVYYGTTTTVSAGSRPSAASLWELYTFTIGYSFVVTLTSWKPVYLKCAPQNDGSAIIDSTTPFVQDLPTTEDGKIYIFLGIAYSTTSMELVQEHPVYYYKDGTVRPWTNAPASTIPVTSVNNQTGAVVLTATDVGALPSSTTIPSKTSDLTNDSGFLTSAVTSFNGSTGAVTYTAPVTSVNGDTGAVTVTVPTKTSDLTNDSGYLTSAVTSFNGNTGAVTYTAPVTSVNGNTGAVTVDVPSAATATPLVDGTAAVGSSSKYAKEDHVHPTDTSRAAASHYHGADDITSGTFASARLPIASSSTLGGVKVDGTTITANSNGVITGKSGTVTEVTAGTGLSIGSTAGGTISASGTINHTNSVTAQATQAIYPITIDAQGHISGYGTAVTPLTASSTLDATKLSGTIPTASLPSYVDDVLEYSAKSSFPATGETGKIYVDTSTNLTWRWGGTAYVQISPSLALGTTSSTAYRGDYGNTAYTHATDANRLTTATASGLYKIAATAQGHVASLTAIQKSDITGLGIPASNTTYSISMSGNVITLTGSDSSTSTVTLPVYAGGVT